MKKLNHKQLEQNRRKLERNKEKKEFIAVMCRFSDLLGGEGTFALLPPHVVENIYHSRVLPIKTNTQYVPDLDAKSTNNLRHLVMDLSSKKEFNIDIKGQNFSLSEFLTVGFTVVRVVMYWRDVEELEGWQNEFISRFSTCLEKELTGQAFLKCYNIATIISLNLYDFEKDMFWFKFELTPPHEGSSQIQHMMYLYREKFETRIFSTDAGPRPALRVCFANVQAGLEYANLEPSLLGVEHPNDEVPVYIQRHALRRLEERLDCMKKYDLRYSVFESMQQPLVVRQNKNKVLIACCVKNVKMGYFAAEYINGALLIHTFLFVTNNGTPEGQKLNDLTGLDKLDKKYLSIDKLSSFMNSDISRNDRLKTLFEKAGCSCLLDIEKTVNSINKNQEMLAISETILKYIDVENRT